MTVIQTTRFVMLFSEGNFWSYLDAGVENIENLQSYWKSMLMLSPW